MAGNQVSSTEGLGKPRNAKGSWRRWLNTIDTLRPALLVTWAVPAERVRPRVPAPLKMDTITDADNNEWALLSVAAVRNVDARPAAFPWGKLTYDQANYRTYVTYEGQSGVFFFGNFVSSRLALLLHRLITPNAFYAPSHLNYAWQRRDGKPVSWGLRYNMQSKLGRTFFDARGTFSLAETPLLGAHAAHFITHRLDGYFVRPSGGGGRLAVDHVEMEPWSGTLRQIQAEPWLKWNLLSAEEIAKPIAIMLQHEVLFTAMAPEAIG